MLKEIFKDKQKRSSIILGFYIILFIIVIFSLRLGTKETDVVIQEEHTIQNEYKSNVTIIEDEERTFFEMILRQDLNRIDNSNKYKFLKTVTLDFIESLKGSKYFIREVVEASGEKTSTYQRKINDTLYNIDVIYNNDKLSKILMKSDLHEISIEIERR